MMQKLVLDRLQGKLWHTTHPVRFKDILAHGAILPEPNIPETERWKTSRGKEFFPYVRSLGGVSLFDFTNFDPKEYNEEYPLSSWEIFVPYRKEWKGSVWIEIERKFISDNFISGPDLIKRWKQEEKYKHTIMPVIEAAYIGSLPKQAFSSAFFAGEGEIVLDCALNITTKKVESTH